MNTYAQSWVIHQYLRRPVVDWVKRPFIKFEDNETVFRSLMLASQLVWLAVIWAFLISALA